MSKPERSRKINVSADELSIDSDGNVVIQNGDVREAIQEALDGADSGVEPMDNSGINLLCI